MIFATKLPGFCSKLPRALPQLQRQLLLDVLKRTDRHDIVSLQEELDAVQLPFESDQLVIPVIIRVEEWNNYQSQADRSLIRYAVANVAEELLQDKAKVKAIDLDTQVIACFIQSQETYPSHVSDTQGDQGSQLDSWVQTLRFVYGTLESVQQSCVDCLNLSVSIMVSEQAVEWSRVNQAIGQLRLSIHESPGLGMEKLLRVNIQDELPYTPSIMNQQGVVTLHLDQIKQRITAGDREWIESFHKWTEAAKEGLPDPFFRMKTYTGAASVLIEVLHELGLYESAMEEISLSRMLHFDIHTAWTDLVIFYQSAYEWMISKRSDAPPERPITDSDHDPSLYQAPSGG
ncbi:hypothetical protein Q0F98_34705 [Paenibacillus amylolyticus]|nr:hypothetical protein Q0F98_34705 [Paenibacillus amylolyticus]